RPCDQAERAAAQVDEGRYRQVQAGQQHDRDRSGHRRDRRDLAHLQAEALVRPAGRPQRIGRPSYGELPMPLTMAAPTLATMPSRLARVGGAALCATLLIGALAAGPATA